MLFRSLTQEQLVYNPVTSQSEKREVVLGYASHRNSKAEQSYSSYRLELTGLIHALLHFRYYLIGKPFVVKTDHRALEWLRTTQNPVLPGILLRLQQLLGDYDFSIQYVTPKHLAVEDAISRLPFHNDGTMASWRVKSRDPWLMEDSFWIKALTKKEDKSELNTYSSFHYQLQIGRAHV